MYLSLPLPTPRTRTLTITIVDAAGTAVPLQVAVEVPKNGTVSDALTKVAALCGDNGKDVIDRWLLAQWAPTFVSNKLELYRDPKTSLATIQERKSSSLFANKTSSLVAYRFPHASRGPGSGFRPIVVFHKAKNSLAGVPAVFYIPTNLTATEEPAAAIEADAGAENNNNSLPAEIAATLPKLVFEKRGRFGGNWILSTLEPIETPLLAYLQPYLVQNIDARALLFGHPAAATASAASELQEKNVFEGTAGLPANSVDEATPMQDSALGGSIGSPGTTTAAAGGVAHQHSRPPSNDGMDVDVDDDVMQIGTEPGTAGVGLVSHPVAVENGGSQDPLPQHAQHEEEGTGIGTAADLIEDDSGSMPDLDPFFSAKSEAGQENSNGGEGEEEDNAAVEMVVESDHQAPSIEQPEDPVAASFGNQKVPTTAPQETATAAAPIVQDAQTLPLPAANPGIEFLLSQASSTARTVIGATPQTGNAASLDPLFLTAEWLEPAAAALDLTPWTNPAQHESAIAAAAAAKAPPRPVTLDDCVDAFLQPEKLDEADSWYCTSCKAHVQAEKKLDLWRLPEVLVVHLKRFSYSSISIIELTVKQIEPITCMVQINEPAPSKEQKVTQQYCLQKDF